MAQHWISTFASCKILDVSSYQTAAKILERAGVRSRQLPGQVRQWDRSQVEQLVRDSVIANATEPETAVSA